MTAPATAARRRAATAPVRPPTPPERTGVVKKSELARHLFLFPAAAVLLGAVVLSLGVGAKFIPASTVV